MNKNRPLKGGIRLGSVSDSDLPYGSPTNFNKALTEGPTELAKKSTLATQSTNNFNKAFTEGSSNLNKAFTEGSNNLNNALINGSNNLNNASTLVTNNLNNASTLVTNNLNNASASGTDNLNKAFTEGSSNLNKAFTEGSEELTKTSASVINASGTGTIAPGTVASASVINAPGTVTSAPNTDASASVINASGTGTIAPGTVASAPNTDATPYNFNELVTKREKEFEKSVAKATKEEEASAAKQSSNPTGPMAVWLAPFVFWSKIYLAQAKAVQAEVGPIVQEVTDFVASTEAEIVSQKDIARYNADSRVKDQAFVAHLEAYYKENSGVRRLDPGSPEWKEAKQKYEDELKEFTEKDDTKEGDTKEGDTKEEKKGEEVKKGWFGGNSRKTLTLGQIQKGGRQSANRTKKSIHDFFKSSVTSSHILKMVKKHGDIKRNTKVKRKRVGKRSRKGRQ